MKNIRGNEIDFTPEGMEMEKELNFAQAFGLATVVVIVLLVLGNLVIGLD